LITLVFIVLSVAGVPWAHWLVIGISGIQVDYKSGAILEQHAATQTDVVKAASIRPLRIYGFLMKQNLAWWPKRGLLCHLVSLELRSSLSRSSASGRQLMQWPYSTSTRFVMGLPGSGQRSLASAASPPRPGSRRSR
jgi:hypothetical protein